MKPQPPDPKTPDPTTEPNRAVRFNPDLPPDVVLIMSGETMYGPMDPDMDIIDAMVYATGWERQLVFAWLSSLWRAGYEVKPIHEGWNN